MLLKDKIEKHLLEVQKPSRYIGDTVFSHKSEGELLVREMLCAKRGF